MPRVASPRFAGRSTLAASAPRRTNLPAPCSSFIGRRDELDAIARAFAAGDRLVTLTGAGGIGKTRLALEEAARALHGDPSIDEVWFCDVTEARSLDALAFAVARVLDVPLAGDDGDPIDRLGDAIAGRGAVLLVLDNFEQIVDRAAASVGRWMEIAPNARFLVTSRERLRLPGERVVALAPLSMPSPDATSAADLAATDAFALFVSRARLIDPSFSVRIEDAPIVAEIVRQLDGIPLAIELAATRMGMMTPADVRDRLQKRFDLLQGGPRTAAQRHQALRGAIDWSWQLLQPWERDALAQCAVFRGGFTLDAAEHVLDLRAHERAPAVLDVLQALHDKSLLRVDATASGARRMGMFVSIGEYAIKKLEEASFAAETRARHERYYLRIGSEWAEETNGPVAAESLRRIAAEQENLIAAFWSAMNGDAAEDANRAVRTVLALEPVLASRGPLTTLLALLDAAVARMAQAGTDRLLNARLLECRGRARRLRSAWGEALRDLEQASAIAREAEDRVVDGRVLAEIGTLHRQRGRMAEARARLEEALAVSRAAGDRRTEGVVLGELGIAHKESGDLARARRLYEAALATVRAVGDRRSEGRFCGDLGALHQEEARFAEARVCFEEALAIHREVGNRRFEAIALSDLGALGLEERRLADAEAAYRQAIAILREVGDLRYEALFTACAAAVQAGMGCVAAAREALQWAESALASFGEPLYLGAVAVHRGHLDLAMARACDDAAAARLHRDRARARLDLGAQRAEGDGTHHAASLAELSDDVRFALRALAAAISADEARAGGMAASADGAWFQIGDAPRVVLASRANLQRMLAALVAARVQEPGRALAVDDLYEAGWPGVKVIGAAGVNRVHVALATLRKLGLAKVLARAAGGYMLDPTTPISVVACD